MRLVWLTAALVLCSGGCTSVQDERFRLYSEDGLSLYQHGNFRDARDSFQAALSLKPDDPVLIYNLGECYDQLGDSAQAEKLYRDCLQRAPNQVACRHALALLLQRTQRLPEAGQMIEDWLARQPGLAAAYAEHGWYLHQVGDLPRAQGRLHQALALDPHDVRALTEMALIYEAMQRPDRAVVLYERALERDPTQTELSKRINYLLASGAGRPRPE
jgi:tetratricopeptide (TPR) repeat protein